GVHTLPLHDALPILPATVWYERQPRSLSAPAWSVASSDEGASPLDAERPVTPSRSRTVLSYSRAKRRGTWVVGETPATQSGRPSPSLSTMPGPAPAPTLDPPTPGAAAPPPPAPFPAPPLPPGDAGSVQPANTNEDITTDDAPSLKILFFMEALAILSCLGLDTPSDLTRWCSEPRTFAWRVPSGGAGSSQKANLSF